MSRLNELLRKRTRPLLMGIVNATGDSFSEGSASAPATAVDRALTLLDDGADLLDIGGESTRPGAAEVAASEEIERIVPVVRQLQRLRPSAILSVDTRKAEVAQAALGCGATVVNDVSMLRYSPEMAGVAASFGAVLIIAHSRGTPRTMAKTEFHDYGADPVAAVAAELAAAKELALQSGIARENLFVDPDFGFAKTPEQDWEILKRIGEIRRLGPVVAGVSRKSFLGKFLDQPEPRQRLGGTIAAALHLACCGVEILRVHDVRQVGDALRVWGKLRSEAGDFPEMRPEEAGEVVR